MLSEATDEIRGHKLCWLLLGQSAVIVLFRRNVCNKVRSVCGPSRSGDRVL